MSVLLFKKKLPVLRRYDIVVCGGGPSGCAAAIAAARRGLDVLLVEGQGQLGGMGTSGLVSAWVGGRHQDGRWVVGGIFREMCLEAEKEGIARLTGDDNTTDLRRYPTGIVTFDPFAISEYLDRKIEAEGIDLLLHTQAVDVTRGGDRITHVVLHNKSGLGAVPALSVIDATGDADMAARAGCGFDKGNDEGNLTPVTLEAHLDNISDKDMLEYIRTHKQPRFQGLVKRLHEGGELPEGVGDKLVFLPLAEGVIMLNNMRLHGYDGTDGESVTRGMIDGRSEIAEELKCLRKHFPGFSDARVKAVASLLGVRETRRIHGEYRLTLEDVFGGREFPDTIGLSNYNEALKDKKKPARPTPEVTPIPYRIMVPTGIENLICPGRSVCAERGGGTYVKGGVIESIRVMAPCMAMGEAAGEAAAGVVSEDLSFARINTEKLRSSLRDHGAIVDPL